MATQRDQAIERQNTAQVIPWPLPLRGLYHEAKNAKISGLFAAELHNLRSNGASIETRPGHTAESADGVLQRIPYPFGDSPHYIELFEQRAVGRFMEVERWFNGLADHAFISSTTIIADGLGEILRYDGSQIIEAGYTSDLIDTRDLNGALAHHDRMYFWQEGKLEFYYAGLGAITGPLARFPLDRLGNISGGIVLMESLTMSAGDGSDDLLMILTSTGDMVIYQGLDPSDPTDWAIWGRAKIAIPVSRFSAARFGSDCLVLTEKGVLSVRRAMVDLEQAINSALSKAIEAELSKVIEEHRENPGWQLFTSPDGASVIVNHPTNSGYRQFIYTTESKSWASADYDARYWHKLISLTSFTDSRGALCTLKSGSDDAGEPITARYVSSWIDPPAASNSIAYLVPKIYARGEVTLRVALLTNRNDTPRDVDEATQEVIITSENEDHEGRQIFCDIIALGDAGDTFQLRIELVGHDMEIVDLKVGIV